MNYLYVFSLLLLITSCSTNKKELDITTEAICNCFNGFSDADAVSMNNTAECMDSISQILPIESIPKKKLKKALDKICPEAKENLSLLLN